VDSKHFDTIARVFSDRRLSRRTTLAAAAGTVAAAAVVRVHAQDATPAVVPHATVVTDEQNEVPFMFVQTFGSGSLAPSEGEAGTLVLTADHLAGQTLFFSDRPERIVGMVSTERLLGLSGGDQGLGFSPADPPNAALVLDDGNVLVVELLDPTYDAATGQVTYGLRVLEDLEQVDLQLEQEPLAVADAPRDFTAASLFIDDCPDGSIVCIRQSDQYTVASFDSGFCFDSGHLCCAPCASEDNSYWENQCNQTWSECNNDCGLFYQEEWACPGIG
jgi:hypothetical protein